MFGLKEKRVVVIGAGSGIGEAVATSSASAGAQVILGGRTEEKLQRVRQQIGSAASAHQVDVADDESARLFFDQVGAFDHLILTAKPTAPAATLAEMTTATSEPLLAVKFLGAVHVLKHSAGKIRSGGSITLVSGVLGWRPSRGAAILGAINGGLASLAMAAALEMAPTRVNVIAPGIINTPTWSGLTDERRKAFFAEVAAKLPVGRIGEPNDIAQAAAFLMTNGFVTGTVLHVDGGALLV